MTALAFHNLSKTFGRGRKKVAAVSELTMALEPGQVFGFLGPNGAGKSTTIRLILDLIRPNTGSVTVFDSNPRKDRSVLRRVGALVEGASFYSYLSAQENLEVLARTAGVYDKAHIADLLVRVGLQNRARKHTLAEFSTGMKQRLGLAAALLGDPDLVILDEPTNGLDPEGIQEIRYFIRALADQEGETVFLSSHILSEVEQVCDRVAIIKEGRLMREGVVGELLSGIPRLRIEADDAWAAKKEIGDLWPCTIEDDWLVLEAAYVDAPVILRYLLEQGIQVYQATAQRQSLEDFFLTTTRAGGEDA